MIYKPKFMQLAIDEALKGLKEKGQGPFGACIVKGKEIISVGNNQVVLQNDPTMHAEICAIRRACQKLKTFDLSGCVIYSTCQPCPMCLSAIYWARLDGLVYGCTKDEAGEIGFDDAFIYEELGKEEIKRKLKTTNNFMHDECKKLFEIWEEKKDRTEY